MYTRYCPSHSLGGSSRTTIILSQGEGNSKDVDRQHDGITCQQPHNKVSADLHCKGNLEANMDVCRQYNFFNNIRAYQFQGEFLFKSFGTTEEVLPGLCNFDNARKHVHFEEGQIWATQYRANLPHSLRYFRVDCNSTQATHITWLKPIPVTIVERRWCDAGLPVACGSFEFNWDMNDAESWPTVSSYKCYCVQSVTHEEFEIYPTRGEIWALYKDWNLDDWTHGPCVCETMQIWVSWNHVWFFKIFRCRCCMFGKGRWLQKHLWEAENWRESCHLPYTDRKFVPMALQKALGTWNQMLYLSSW